MKSVVWYLRVIDTDLKKFVDKVIKTSSGSELKVVLDNRKSFGSRFYWQGISGDTEKDRLLSQFKNSVSDLLKVKKETVSFLIVNDGSDWDEISGSLKGSVVIINQVLGYKEIIDKLLRIKLCDIFLINQKAWNSDLKVAAAIDPFHENESRAESDSLILRKARQLTGVHQKAIKVVHSVYVPPAMLKHKKTIKDIHREELDVFVKDNYLGSKSLILLEGLPEYSIPEWVSEEEIDVLCLGLTSRSWLSEVFIGSTTREIVNDPVCDLIIVNTSKL